jgi:ferric-dicitrate binding protein FerR (iron transport regulator)
MNIVFSLLVSKVLAGEASEQEKMLLRQWLYDNADDTLLYNQLKEYWDADVAPDKALTVSTDEKIFNHIRTAAYRKHDFKLLFYRIAAVVLLLLTCGTIYYYKTYPVHSYTYATQYNVADFVLQDGTKVKLNKNSAVTFASDFGKKNRRIDLTGEAFFEVQKDTSKPFTVYAQGTETEVLGTTFDVRSDELDGMVRVTLIEGSVCFVAGKRNALLYPQDEIVYRIANDSLNKYVSPDVQINTEWTTGRYFYADITFGELLKKLEQIYDVSVVLNYPALETKKITASIIAEESIDEILSALETELKFKFKYKKTEETDRTIITIDKR